jgi:hypothetical protein
VPTRQDLKQANIHLVAQRAETATVVVTVLITMDTKWTEWYITAKFQFMKRYILYEPVTEKQDNTVPIKYNTFLSEHKHRPTIE